MTVFLSLAIALIVGLLMTRVTSIWKLPDVTAYLIAGVLVGPYCLGLLGIDGVGFTSMEQVTNVGFVSDAALGFIAFTIGNEFRMSQLRQTGRKALIVGICEAVITTVVVDLVFLALHLILKDQMPVQTAIVLGAIAAATAPAATLMVVRQFKAKGEVTDVLLPVVALDDAVGLALFAVSFGVAQAIAGGAVSVFSVVVEPLIEIVLSLAMGAVMGAILSKIEGIFRSNRNRMALIIGFVLLTVALAKLKIPMGIMTVDFSPLLVCMALGTVFCNLCSQSEDMMDKVDKWTAPLFALFFIVSGAGLELNVFSSLTVVLIGVVYILFRCAGKYLGALVGSTAAGCSPKVKKYLGITLFPQAGVALGMCVTVVQMGQQGMLIKNIILFGVLIYELVGPMLTKMALIRSGDIRQIDTASRRRIRQPDQNDGKKTM